MNKQDNPLVWPNVEAMTADALGIIQQEILLLKTKQRQGRTITQQEAKTLQGYVKSLVELSREDRERARDADLADLTPEQLVAALGDDVIRRIMSKPALPGKS